MLFVFATLLPFAIIAAFLKDNTAIDQTYYHFVGDWQILDASAAGVFAQIDCGLRLPVVTAPLPECAIFGTGDLAELFYLALGLEADFGDAGHHFRVHGAPGRVIGAHFVIFRVLFAH